MPSWASDRSGADGSFIAVARDRATGMTSESGCSHMRARLLTYVVIGAAAGTARSTWRCSPTTVIRQCSSTVTRPQDRFWTGAGPALERLDLGGGEGLVEDLDVEIGR